MTTPLDLLYRLLTHLKAIDGTHLDMQSAASLRDARELCLALIRSGESFSPTPTSEDQPASQPIPSIAVPQGPTRLLIIDDDADLQKVLQFALPRHGFATAGFVSPRAALHAFDQVRPHLILMGLMLPELSGFEVLGHLAQRPDRRQFRVLVASSRSFDQDWIAALRAGADDFIAKPYQLSELVLRLQNLLQAPWVRVS